MVLKLSKIEKRRVILSEATAIFARHGYRNTDVQDIANAAGVGKGTVYRYFGNKQELFLAAADFGMRRLEAAVMPMLEEYQDPFELMTAVSLGYFRFFAENLDVVELLIQHRAEFRGQIPDTHQVYSNKNRGVFELALQQAIDEKRFPDVDVQSLTTTLGNYLYGTVVRCCLENQGDRLVDIGRQGLELFMTGLQTRMKETS